jgi:hypothetical protein
VPLKFNFINDPRRGGEVIELLSIEKESVNGHVKDSHRLWSQTMDKGRWHEFVMHVNWSKCDQYDPSNGRCILDNNPGIIELWYDGVKQHLTDPTRYNG